MVESQRRSAERQGLHQIKDLSLLICRKWKSKGELQDFAEKRRRSVDVLKSRDKSNEQCVQLGRVLVTWEVRI